MGSSKTKSKVNITKAKSSSGGSMPWLPANVANLPKNIPPFKKNKTFFDPWFNIDKKVDKMNEALKVKKLEVKQRKGKTIKYKKISHWEYEVSATDRLLGKIEQKSNNKWIIKPSFDYEEDFYNSMSLKEEHYDFSKAGNALVDFWINN